MMRQNRAFLLLLIEVFYRRIKTTGLLSRAGIVKFGKASFRMASGRRNHVVGRTPWNADVAQQRIRELLHLDGPLLPILQALQDEFGYIDAAAEPLVADSLN